MNKFIIPIIIAVVLIGGLIFYFSSRSSSSSGSEITQTTPTENVKIEDGKQIIEVLAKGGFNPRQTVAKANMPTILRMNTNNTFDCSASLIIPKIGYRENLNPTKTTDIKIPAQKPGSTLTALCAMGMYSFEIRFN